MLKEAEFCFKQSYAFCPYSPEAVFRYINLLITVGRVDDALLLAQTSKTLDPNNGQIDNLLNELGNIKNRQQGMAPSPQAAANPAQLQAEAGMLEQQFQANPADMQVASKLMQDYLQLGQREKVLAVIDRIIANPQANAESLLMAAQVGNQLQQMPKVEEALSKLVKVSPGNPEALFDLAGIRAILNKKPEALDTLRQSLKANLTRWQKDKNAHNLYSNAMSDERFAALRSQPEFQKLMADPEVVAK
jgi:thioredoxin-like negative regulator of GroEL